MILLLGLSVLYSRSSRRYYPGRRHLLHHLRSLLVTFKKQVVNILLRTLPEQIVNLIRPPQIPVVDPVPPPVQQPLLGAAA
jgi:hypothetical protein